MPASSKLDENWTKTTDAVERRRIQNRVAQRNYRNNIKQRLRQLELLDNAFSKEVGLSAANLSREENDEDDVLLLQQQNVPSYPAPQPVATQSDSDCYWLPNQNEISVSGHADIHTDSITSQIEPNQYIFGLNSAQHNNNRTPSLQSQNQKYTSFGVSADPSHSQGQHANLTYNRPSSGQTTPTHSQLQYHNRPESSDSSGRRRTLSNPDTHPAYSVGSVPTQLHTHSNSQPQVYKINSLAPSEKDALQNTRQPARNLSKSVAAVPQATLPNSGTPVGGGTPLHHAATNGHLHVVGYLLSKGANLIAANNAGQTALHLAAERGHDAVVEHILNEDMNQYASDDQLGGGARVFIDKVDDQGFTALHRAAASGHEECVRILIEAGAEMESACRSLVPPSEGSSGSKDDGF